MTSQVKDEIEEYLYDMDTSTTKEKADHVIAKMDELDLLRIYEFRHDHKELHMKLENQNQKIADLTKGQQELTELSVKLGKKLDDKETQIKIEREARNYLSQLRQVQNILFNQLWKENASNIANLDYINLAQLTPELRNKKLYSNDGVKLALAVLHDKCNCCSKALCTEYILLNNRYHPSTRPLSKVIENIEKLKLIYAQYPECNNIGGVRITESVINELISQLLKHKKEFQ